MTPAAAPANARRAHARPTRRLAFFCPDIAEPTGGLQVIYRHVDLLNEAGIDATVVHQAPGFRCGWFENDTRVIDASRLQLRRERDVLVVPEILISQVVAQAPRVPKVVYNQNAHYTFNSASSPPVPGPGPYDHPDVQAVVVVSEHNEEYVRHAFPHQRVERVRLGVDSELFRPNPDKGWRLAFMPRKNPHDSLQVLNILQARGVLDGIEVLALDGLPRREVARALGQTLLFLSFGHPEGFGLPAAEAMACGCVTVGYHGMGGREFLRRPYAHPVEQGDIVGYARTVEALVAALRSRPEPLLAEAEAAAAYIADAYSPERERESVLACWRGLLDDRPARG